MLSLVVSGFVVSERKYLTEALLLTSFASPRQGIIQRAYNAFAVRLLDVAEPHTPGGRVAWNEGSAKHPKVSTVEREDSYLQGVTRRSSLFGSFGRWTWT